MDGCDCQFVTLSSSDGIKTDRVPFGVVRICDIVTNAAGECDKEEIAVCVQKVRAEVLKLIINFCYHYSVEPFSIETPLCSIDIYDLVPKWYADFVMTLKPAMFFEVMEAANYMGIQPLIGLTCLVAAILFNRKSASAIRSVFNCNPRVTEDLGGANRKRGSSADKLVTEGQRLTSAESEKKRKTERTNGFRF